jgi:hypothetical protein
LSTDSLNCGNKPSGTLNFLSIEILNCGYEEESLNCSNLFLHMEDILNLMMEWAPSGLMLATGIGL